MNTSLMFSSKSPEWATPQPLFDALNTIHHFTLDAAASDNNAKCPIYFTADENALLKNWGGVQRVLQSAVWPGNWRMGPQRI